MYFDFTILIVSSLSLINTAMGAKYFLEYYMSARKLPASDAHPSNPPDVYCKVLVRDGSSSNKQWATDGYTEEITSFNPDWHKTFNVDWTPLQSKDIKIEVYDKDTSSSEFLGDVTLAVSLLVDSNGGKIFTGPTDLEKEIKHEQKHNGKLIISSRITKIDSSRAACGDGSNVTCASASRNQEIALHYKFPVLLMSLGYFL